MSRDDFSFNQKAGMLIGGLSFVLLVLDALNGFAAITSIQPFATKGYVETIIRTEFQKVTETEAEINARLANLQLMSLEMSLQLIDGQLERARSDQVDFQSKLVTTPNDVAIRKRLAEVQGKIDELIQRRVLLSCFLDKLRGYTRDCR